MVGAEERLFCALNQIAWKRSFEYKNSFNKQYDYQHVVFICLQFALGLFKHFEFGITKKQRIKIKLGKFIMKNLIVQEYQRKGNVQFFSFIFHQIQYKNSKRWFFSEMFLLWSALQRHSVKIRPQKHYQSYFLGLISYGWNFNFATGTP